MKGIILASGMGSRLYSITKIINKHLFFVRHTPMIYPSVYKLRECGITDIIVINGKEHMDDGVSFLGSETEFEMSVTYHVQEKEITKCMLILKGNFYSRILLGTLLLR